MGEYLTRLLPPCSGFFLSLTHSRRSCNAPNRSNLSSQVFVFNDEGNTVDDMLMEPKGTRTISICVAPKFNIDELKDGTCRTLIGGLQLFLTAPADGREAVRHRHHHISSETSSVWRHTVVPVGLCLRRQIELCGLNIFLISPSRLRVRNLGRGGADG